MKRVRKHSSIAVGVAVVAVSLLSAAPAQAATVVTPFHDQGSETWAIGDRCPADVVTFPIVHTWDMSLKIRTSTNGSDKYGGPSHLIETLSANGRELTRNRQFNLQTQNVSTNDDGTLTVSQSFTGNDILREGSTIAFHDAGRGQVTLLVNTMGTPDPADDDVTVLSLVYRGLLSGLDDHFCESLAFSLR